MKNRERIKGALLLSLREETRKECKDRGLTRKNTEEFLISRTEKYDRLCEQIIKEYDEFLINTLVNELSSTLRQSVEKDNQIIISHFQGIVDTANKNIANLSSYHKFIREKVLDEEILHLEGDLELIKQHKKALERIAISEANRVSWYFVLPHFVSVIIWCGLIYKNGWDEMEKWTWISTGILIFLNALYRAFYKMNFSSEDLRKEKLKKATEHVYQLYKFDDEKVKRYEKILESKKKELEKIKERKQETYE